MRTVEAAPITPQPPSASTFPIGCSGTGRLARDPVILSATSLFILLVPHKKVRSSPQLSNTRKPIPCKDIPQPLPPRVDRFDDSSLSPSLVDEHRQFRVRSCYSDLTTSPPFTIPTMRAANSHGLRRGDDTSVRTQRNRFRYVVSSPDPTARHQDNFVPNALRDQVLVDFGNRVFHRHCNVLLRNLRSRPRPSVPTVNMDNIRPSVIAANRYH